MDKQFHEIYQKHANYVYRFCLHLTKDINLAEELTQETFYQAIKSIDKYKGLCKIQVWLCQIAKNQYYNYLKKEDRNSSLPVDYEEKAECADFQSPEEIYIKKEMQMNIEESINSLLEPSRTVVILRLVEELSFKEIGDVFGKSENWARVTFYRAKQKIIEGSRRYENNL
ncbi:MAG: RNA polymerase sigma factor [Lachnospiraceae bacterium]